MAGLRDGYVVVVGNYNGVSDSERFWRDKTGNFGQFYHGHTQVDVNGTRYEAAVDVNLPGDDGQPKTEFMEVDIDPQVFAPILALPSGEHPLAKSSTSGAIDYIRYTGFHTPNRPQGPDLEFDRTLFGSDYGWNKATGINALDGLEAMVRDSSVVRVFIFGEPFHNPDGRHGVHNVHQNQGDPVGGGHDFEDAIWQDGMIVVQLSNGRLRGFMVKFLAQSYETDSNGRPLPSMTGIWALLANRWRRYRIPAVPGPPPPDPPFSIISGPPPLPDPIMGIVVPIETPLARL